MPNRIVDVVAAHRFIYANLEKDDAKAFIGNLNTLAAKHAGGDAILKVAFFETSLLAIAFGEQETYCDGWSKGYSTGFC
jgi:hypothetical protein